jgi:hypothetical protein
MKIQNENIILADRLRATLRSLSLASVLSHSDNRVYLVRATPSPKLRPLVATSDILKTLDEMAAAKIH